MKMGERETAEQMIEGVGTGMMSALGPLMAAANAITDEAKAWDEYVVAYVRAMGKVERPNGGVRTADPFDAAKFADELVKLRKQRFNAEKTKALVIEATSNKDPQLVCGVISRGPSPSICRLPTYHEGPHSFDQPAQRGRGKEEP
jgi:hypothetical protein